MTGRVGSRARGWLALAAAAAAVAGFLLVAQLVSPSLPGAAGAVYEQNCRQGIDASALFYTEVTDVGEFLDLEHGRYGLDVRPRLKFAQEVDPDVTPR